MRGGEKPPRFAKLSRPASSRPEPSRPEPAAPVEPPARDDAPLPPKRRAAPRVDLEKLNRLRHQRRDRAAAAEGTPPAPKRSFGRAGRILGVAAVVATLLVLWFLFSVFQPFAGDGEGKLQVDIPKGSGVGEIADVLEKEGVISSATFFEIRATIGGNRGDLKPGGYTLKKDMSFSAAIDVLSVGPPKNVVTVTIPEGRSRREITPLVRDAGLEGSYTKATIRARGFSPRRYGARRARDLEGFLFPATFELKKGTPVKTLVGKQLDAFETEFAKVDLSAAKQKNLSAYEVLIIASMVEREAMLDRERPMIASVIYNRLKRREPLGIDATIRFATNNWTEPLTKADLALDSAYNTRARQGLPPGPIGNPGLESIRAAAKPAKTSFLFYVVKPNTCGEHAFSRTLAEFERDARRYDVERARRGGKSPTDC